MAVEAFFPNNLTKVLNILAGCIFSLIIIFFFHIHFGKVSLYISQICLQSSLIIYLLQVYFEFSLVSG